MYTPPSPQSHQRIISISYFKLDIKFIDLCSICLTNRFQVAVRLFSNRSQRTSNSDSLYTHIGNFDYLDNKTCFLYLFLIPVLCCEVRRANFFNLNYANLWVQDKLLIKNLQTISPGVSFPYAARGFTSVST